MRTATIPLAVTLVVASAPVVAQTPGDPMAALRACSQLEGSARLDCLDKLSRDIAPPPRAVPPPAPAPAAAQDKPAAADTWLVSETTSPVDYTPVAVATAQATGTDGGVLQLSIQCRGGRSEMVVSGPTAPRPEDYTVSYRVNGGAPVPVATGAPASGSGAAFRTDIAALLRSLPDDGEISVRLATRQGAARDGNWSLAALKTVRERLAATCKWPFATRN
jgi:hypothetical protein